MSAPDRPGYGDAVRHYSNGRAGVALGEVFKVWGVGWCVLVKWDVPEFLEVLQGELGRFRVVPRTDLRWDGHPNPEQRKRWETYGAKLARAWVPKLPPFNVHSG